MFRIFKSFSPVRHFCAQSTTKLVDSLLSTVEAVDRETLDKLLTSVPQLTRYAPELWSRTYQLMSREGIEPANFLSIVSAHPELLARDTDRLAGSMHCWRSCQFGDKQMQALLSAHPQLLDFTDQNKLAQRVAFLHSYFETRRNVWRLLLNSPSLVVDTQHSVQQKADYLLQQMRIEVPEVVKSCAFSAELEVIRCRHVFLERLGLFKARSLKADPGDPNNNPKLHQITDTTDKRFAVKVAFVSLEEYEVFQELYAREQRGRGKREAVTGEEEAEEEDDWDDGREEAVARKKNYRKGAKRRN